MHSLASMRMNKSEDAKVASIGIEGLDEILGGGFPKGHVYLIQGDPGAGKTTLSLQFLMQGVAEGEQGLYVTLSESLNELTSVAASHGWELDGISIYEQLVGEEMLSDEEDLTLFHPSEIELGETINNMLREVERVQPKRVVIDSLSEIRLLSQSTLKYRKQILALKDFFAKRKITAFFLDDKTAETNDLQLHSVPHGVLVLERLAPIYGAPRRRLEVVKVRGTQFRGGYHDFSILTGGIAVYPRLKTSHHRRAQVDEGQIQSGVAEIDKMTGGGLRRGNSTLVIGPAGAGKSTLSAQYVTHAAEHGEKCAMFIFDESVSTLLARCRDLNMPLGKHVESGAVTVQQIDPAELSPGEFTHQVKVAVEKHGASVIVIDSLNGYLNSMPEERYLSLQLHELLSYLGERNVTTIVVMAQHGFIGSGMSTVVDVSYLADCVILLRYYETAAEIKKAISILKKRSGPHEKSIRDYDLSSNGISVGEPLRQFRGLLTGTPISVDAPHSPYENDPSHGA